METAVETTTEQVHQGTLNIKPFEFAPGQSGNPAGRPKGSRSKLSEDYLADLYEDWKLHGKDTITKVREKNPEIYLQCVARLVPKDIKLEIPQLNKITHLIIDMPNTISELSPIVEEADEPIDLLPVVTQAIESKAVTDDSQHDDEPPPHP